MDEYSYDVDVIIFVCRKYVPFYRMYIQKMDELSMMAYKKKDEMKRVY